MQGVRSRAGGAWAARVVVLLLWATNRADGSGFSLLDYNTHGNGASDWSTNSAQVRAIGRQMQFLQPDVVTFQEIPFSMSWQMTNFVAAFLPGYHLAANSGTDGYIRSVVLSRFPITRSAKWLDGVSLAEFGNASRFTRDLFEAEIEVPGLSQPLHVFTTHLKSGQDSTSSARRGAEAQAISNFFATVFLPAHPNRPYVLTGDMNEDLDQPPSGTGHPFASLVSDGTNLRMTAPTDPSSGNIRTYSIQAVNLTRRYDYILPCGLLGSNVVFAAVFRTDTADGDILPATSSDSATSSDHLPVLMVFADPYEQAVRITRIEAGDGSVDLAWDSVPGGVYQVEQSTNLTDWSAFGTHVEATAGTVSFVTNAVAPSAVYRVRVGR